MKKRQYKIQSYHEIKQLLHIVEQDNTVKHC